MKKRLNVLVTGVSGELGSLIASDLASLGHNVTGLDIKSPSGRETGENLFKFINFDLAKVEKIPGKMESLLSEVNGIDVLINNASIRSFRNFESFTFNEIDVYLKVNLQAAFSIISALLPGMRKNKFGRIINISSISAFNGYKTGSLYCSTKSALLPFAEALSKELEEENNNITINTICPDSFVTIRGEKLEDFDKITGKIKERIREIIDGNGNGKVYNIFPFRSRIRYILSSLKKLWL